MKRKIGINAKNNMRKIVKPKMAMASAKGKRIMRTMAVQMEQLIPIQQQLTFRVPKKMLRVDRTG